MGGDWYDAAVAGDDVEEQQLRDHCAVAVFASLVELRERPAETSLVRS
jgi:hypothetical protein